MGCCSFWALKTGKLHWIGGRSCSSKAEAEHPTEVYPRENLVASSPIAEWEATLD